VLVRDQAQDYTPQAASCERAKNADVRSERENAYVFGASPSRRPERRRIQTEDVRVSCRVVPIRKEIK
jgi:hypothetical protein